MYLKLLYINAMKRLTIKLCVLRPHKGGSGKNNFQWCKSMTVRGVKWCRRSAIWRKCEKKFRKSLQVQKKCLPLQSRYETRASHWGLELSGGVRKRVAEAAEYDGVHWKDWNESTRKQVPNTKKSRALISWKLVSAGLNLRYKKYTKKSLILAQDER